MEQEITTQESDKLILEELWIVDETTDQTNPEEIETEESTTEEVNEETEEEELEEEVEMETTDDESEEEVETETEEEPKKVNKFAKLLGQRNKARKEAEETTNQVQELQAKLDKLEKDWDYGNEEYINTLVEKRMEERMNAQDSVTDFFAESDLWEFKKDILAVKRETWLPIERAAAIYLAENNPSLLMTDQAKAKVKANVLKTPSRTSKKLANPKLDYSDAEFERLASAGKITF